MALDDTPISGLLKMTNTNKVNINYDKVNNLLLEDYEFVFGLSNIHRPTDSQLEKKFRGYDKEVIQRLSELTKFWDERFPNSSMDRKDTIEEWIEEACLLESSLKILNKVYILLPNGFIFKKLSDLPYIGHIPGTAPHIREQNNNLDNDLVFPELEPFLGRQIILAKPDYQDILEKSEFMLSKYDNIFLKWLGASKVRKVSRLSSLEEVRNYLEFDLYMLENLWNKRLSIQEGLMLEKEIRFFIVNGELADYSPVAWWMTPLETKKELDISNYLAKLEEVVAALKEGASVSNHTYVIDLAYDTVSKNVILVEMNPIHNSGLYGNTKYKYVQKIKENPRDFILRKIFMKNH